MRATPGLFTHATKLSLAALLLLLSSVGAARAQGEAPDVTLSVRGITGPIIIGKRRRFVAVGVVMENTSVRDSRGTLRVYRARDRVQGQDGRRRGVVTPDQSLFYERAVEVPRGGRRVETVYYYCQEEEPEDQLCVSYEPQSGPHANPTFPQFKVLGNEQQLLVLSSRSQSAKDQARAFRSAIIGTGRRPYPTQVSNADLTALPDHMAGYDPFDAILVSEVDEAELPPERAEPLLDWVSAGGDLIVTSTGGRGEIPAAIRKVLPAIPAASGSKAAKRRLTALRSLAPGAPLPRPEPVLVDRVQALSGSEVLAGDGGGPLLVRGRHGAGYVTYVAFPLDAAPLRQWAGLPAFVASLLRSPREDLEPARGIPPMPPLEELLLNLSEALETLEPPSALAVAPLLLLYVALVSPLNFLLLSRLKRLGLSQVVAALVALFFGFLFFGIGYLYKGSDALVTQIGLVELPTRPGKARVSVMTGYFSTDRGLTDATTPTDSVVGPIANQTTSREGRVIQDADGARLASLTLDTWALRRFRTLRVEDVGHLKAELQARWSGEVTANTRAWGGFKLSGRISNETSFRLESTALLFDGACLELGTLGPGATLRLTGNRASWIREELPALSLPKALYADTNNRYPSRYGEGISGDDPFHGSAERRILATLRARLERVPYAPGKIPALLVARVEADPEGTLLEGDARTTLSRVIVLTELQVDAPAGERQAFRGLRPRVVRIDPSMWLPTSGRTGSPPTLRGALGAGNPARPGYVEWTWQLPASADAPIQLDALSVRWRLDKKPLHLTAKLHAFDFRRGQWIPLYTDMSEAELDARGNGKWPPEDVHPLIHHIVDPSTGAVRVRMLNFGLADLQVERVELDAAFKR